MRASEARTGLSARPACHRSWLAYGTVSPLTPEVGAVCGKAARTDLCGGREVTRVPTAKAARVGSALVHCIWVGGIRSADAGTHLSRWRYFYQRQLDRAVSPVRSAGTRKARLRGGPQSHAGDAVRRATRHSKACKRSGGH